MMKRLIATLVAATCIFTAAACGDDDSNPTSPSPSNTLVFRANMTSAQEVPPVTNAEAGSSGTATMTFTVTRDGSNTITGGTVVFNFTVSGLTPTSSITLAHIHTGASGVAGGILVNTGLSAAAAISTPAGSGSFTSSSVTVEAATINSIVANPAGFYFNVHTSLNPSGVVRGQLVAQ
jgi:hypothetical protein